MKYTNRNTDLFAYGTVWYHSNFELPFVQLMTAHGPRLGQMNALALWWAAPHHGFRTLKKLAEQKHFFSPSSLTTFNTEMPFETKTAAAVAPTLIRGLSSFFLIVPAFFHGISFASSFCHSENNAIKSFNDCMQRRAESAADCSFSRWISDVSGSWTDFQPAVSPTGALINPDKEVLKGDFFLWDCSKFCTV